MTEEARTIYDGPLEQSQQQLAMLARSAKEIADHLQRARTITDEAKHRGVLVWGHGMTKTLSEALAKLEESFEHIPRSKLEKAVVKESLWLEGVAVEDEDDDDDDDDDGG